MFSWLKLHKYIGKIMANRPTVGWVAGADAVVLVFPPYIP